MKAFTAIFAIGAILSTTLASPVAVGDVAVERLEVEQRDVEVDIATRQLEPISGLPSLPPITLPANPSDLGPALSNALSQVVTILGVIRAGLPQTPGLPPLPDLPALPGVTIPAPGLPVSPDALVAQLALLQSRLAILQQIFGSLPIGANLDQLRDALNILRQIQAQTTPVLAVIRSLVGSGGLPLPANLPGVEAISSILSTLLSLLGALFGVLPIFGGIGGAAN
ncbi:hypothetical protein KVR01_004074 [Diaporthe batatas]|uniref:uncharacterized protein n=1 Tax=Diaporthe batatas TaxID=748121 RepID=UPI001D04F1F2|nr:uncharacterized protein KVR01_004074 [Diaporthe batatas]KAG8165522.1 hypothetical protein KVR01_004074 [Diaporthe batatas]